jgi:hypothetical protein
MKIILIVLTLLLISCSQEPNKEIIELSIVKSVKFDQNFWNLSHVTVVETIKNSSFDSSVDFCADIKAAFKLTLKKNCYLNNGSVLENNVVVSWIKNLVAIDAIKVKVYEQDVCINDEEIYKEMEEDIVEIKSKLNTIKCLDLIESDRCKYVKNITQRDVDEEILLLKKQVRYSLDQMQLYKKDYSENLTAKFRLCRMKNNTWEYWEAL